VRRSFAVLRDPELVELFADEPELLAIADAIAATAPMRRKRRVHPRIVVASLAAVAAAAVALVAPWNESQGGVVQRALAAITPNEALYVVLESQVPGATTIDLRTGRVTPLRFRIETWFDANRGLRRTVTLRGGLRSEVLETPQGIWSDAGRVPTCSWIAAHPVKATQLRVSCSASGRNGTVPRRVPEARPIADPAFGAFISGYHAALQSGRARNLGEGHVGTRPVYWIGFNVGSGRTAMSERVAVDRNSYRPVSYRVVAAGKFVATARVVGVAVIDYAPSLFRRPTRNARPAPVSGQVAGTRHVRSAVAEAALAGAARSLGAGFASLPLIDARIDELTTGYGPLSHRPVSRASGVQFIYGDSGGILNGSPFLRISEALTPQMAYGMDGQASGLKRGSLLLTRVESQTVAANGSPAARRVLWFGRLRAGRLYVALQGNSRQTVVRAAQALGNNTR
jgi:hypothetical protein